jgi:transketolase
LDEEVILKSLAKTKCVVTAEEHNIFDLERVSRGYIKQPCPQEFVAVKALVSLEHRHTNGKYKLNNQAIVEAVERVIKENNLLYLYR